MIYKKKNLDKILLNFLNYYNNFYTVAIKKSIKKNKKIKTKIRLNQFLQKTRKNSDNCFYRSKYKPYCFLSYNSRVPNSKLGVSRFYLTKHANSLYIPNYQK